MKLTRRFTQIHLSASVALMFAAPFVFGGDAPLWDGHETVADYAKRVNLPPTKTLDLGGGIKMELVLIPAGKFKMGSPELEYQRSEDETLHEVTITEPYYLSKFETTQEQYKAILGSNPSQFIGATLPVEQVSWDDAQEFCRKLTMRVEETVKLPTEAQWEYACRAGTSTRFYAGNKESDVAGVGWHEGNSKLKTHPVGELKPNGFGLYDMHGNVFEWCEDRYGVPKKGTPAFPLADYSAGAASDPRGPETGSGRVIRGGSYYHNVVACRSAIRFWMNPSNYGSSLGFRVVVPVSNTP